MRQRTVTVYYCDHCGARRFQVAAMARHERTCTKNLNRACGMCERIEEVLFSPAVLAALLPAPKHEWGYDDDDEHAG